MAKTRKRKAPGQSSSTLDPWQCTKIVTACITKKCETKHKIPHRQASITSAGAAIGDTISVEAPTLCHFHSSQPNWSICLDRFLDGSCSQPIETDGQGCNGTKATGKTLGCQGLIAAHANFHAGRSCVPFPLRPLTVLV